MRRVSMKVVLLVGLVVPAALPAQQAAPDPERAAVAAVITGFAEKVQANDLAALDSIFPARGVHILVDTATTHGWAEYRDRFLKPEMARYPGLRYAHTAVEAVVRGNVAWVAFRRQLSSGAQGATPVPGRGTAVLEKRDNRWIIVHLHMSE